MEKISRTEQRNIKFTSDEENTIKEISSVLGLTFAGFCRMAILKKISEEKIILQKMEAVN